MEQKKNNEIGPNIFRGIFERKSVENEPGCGRPSTSKIDENCDKSYRVSSFNQLIEGKKNLFCL